MRNTSGVVRTPAQLIEALVQSMSCWDKYEEHYLKQIAPMLVKNPKSAAKNEKPILLELKSQLTESEWEALPQLMAEFRKGTLRKFEVDRLRCEAEDKEREEAELKRIHRECLRQKANLKKKELLARIDKELQRNFLGAEEFFKLQTPGIVSADEFRTKKINFVRDWLVKRNEHSKTVPDDEQLEAIATVNGHVQVVARAGSGKTSTLVYRTLFLIEHCRVASSSLLLLAFNRKAAIEIQRRLLALMHYDAERQVKLKITERHAAAIKKRSYIDKSVLEADSVGEVARQLNIALPHVMTFHALAYALVHPEESLLYNDSEDESQGLSRVFQCVIDDHIQLPGHMEEIRRIMTEHFKDDWDRIVAGGYDLSKDELLQFKRSLPRESLRGEYVKSYGEKLIANFLFEHDIPYKYERNHWWSKMNYRPDFTIFKTEKSGIIIEYFGLVGDPDYDEMSEQKRQYWASKVDWELIELSPSDIKRGEAELIELLRTHLEQRQISCNQLSEDEIWRRIRNRAIDRFTKAMVAFVGRCRKLSLSPDELHNLIDAHDPISSAEAMFLPVAHKLYSAYLDRLSATGEDDFDGLIQRAVKKVLNGETRFQRKSGNGDLANLEYIFIDEFQDFSDLFYRLLCSIRKASPDVQLFCVGDDWQAINGFAGSDLRFFEQFEELIGESHRLYISKNYRSTKSIVDVSNKLMEGLGKPAIAFKQTSGRVIIANASSFSPSLIEQKRHLGDIITPMVARIASESLFAGSHVVLLSRMNTLPWYINNPEQEGRDGKSIEKFLEQVRSLFPKDIRERITVFTAHRYKGLEKETVIILDAVERCYPSIHPDWVFSRVFGVSPVKISQEEQRLFYVALTRAIDKLVIITDGQSQTSFLPKIMPLTKLNWDDYCMVGEKNTLLTIKVGNQGFSKDMPTYAIKDQLKACGYQWKTTGWPSWGKACLAEGFQLSTIKREIWAEKANGIEVRIYDESERTLGVFNINRGNWDTVVNDLHLIARDSENSVDAMVDDMEIPMVESRSSFSSRG